MNKEQGSSIIEVLIAIAILSIGISAAAMLSFASQSLELDTDTSHEALYKAKEILENARADSRENFYSVNTSVPTTEEIYTKQLLVSDDTQCRKTATSTITWNVSALRPQSIELVTILTDVAGTLALGGDCDVESRGDWDNPATAVSLGIGGQGTTGIDVKDSIIYLTSDPSPAATEDFLIYSFDSDSPFSLTELGLLNTGGGLADVDTDGVMAYVANVETSRQLMIIDVSDRTNPDVIASSSLPFMSTGRGRSIFYLSDKVYIGTQYLACPPTCDPEQNNELHVYDVSDPFNPSWMGGENVNHNINDIVVRGNYAYIASSNDSGELLIYDISNPSDISLAGLFNASGTEDGLSTYLIGNKLYLGRERVNNASERDFYVIDITNPFNPTELGAKNLALNPNSEVVGVVVRSDLAFLAIDDPNLSFRILNVSNPSNITDHTSCTSVNFSQGTSDVDMEGNFVFLTNISQNEIRVVHDLSSQCTP